MYGTLLSIKMIPSKSCAFITFADRDSAEKAATEVGGRFKLGGKQLRLDWSRAVPGEGKVLDGQPQRQEEHVSAQMEAGATALFVPHYPSMDPRNIGNALLEDPEEEQFVEKGKEKGKKGDGKGK